MYLSLLLIEKFRSSAHYYGGPLTERSAVAVPFFLCWGRFLERMAEAQMTFFPLHLLDIFMKRPTLHFFFLPRSPLYARITDKFMQHHLIIMRTFVLILCVAVSVTLARPPTAHGGVSNAGGASSGATYGGSSSAHSSGGAQGKGSDDT